jgi:3-deoxy-manno-octulosonate cytidylyltransferase (CMP-KDO synthetase)
VPSDGVIPLETYVQHIGIYGYRAATLQKIAQLSPSFLENTEKLEQLRWLENGYRILTARSEHESFSVDTPEDLIKISSHFSGE